MDAPESVPSSSIVKRWLPLVALAGAQFVMVLDQSVMNVSISKLVDDFHTTVTVIQGVITFYCLVMAMLMLTGAKVGDIIGRRRAFAIGLVIYGCGSAIASSSLVTEWVKGKTLDEAEQIKNTDIAQELALPPVKIHCSVLAEDAIKAAINDYRVKNGMDAIKFEESVVH